VCFPQYDYPGGKRGRRSQRNYAGTANKARNRRGGGANANGNGDGTLPMTEIRMKKRKKR